MRFQQWVDAQDPIPGTGRYDVPDGNMDVPIRDEFKGEFLLWSSKDPEYPSVVKILAQVERDLGLTVEAFPDPRFKDTGARLRWMFTFPLPVSAGGGTQTRCAGDILAEMSQPEGYTGEDEAVYFIGLNEPGRLRWRNTVQASGMWMEWVPDQRPRPVPPPMRPYAPEGFHWGKDGLMGNDILIPNSVNSALGLTDAQRSTLTARFAEILK